MAVTVCKNLPSGFLSTSKYGSLHKFERTKVGIYYDIGAFLAAKKCKNVSLFFKIKL